MTSTTHSVEYHGTTSTGLGSLFQRFFAGMISARERQAKHYVNAHLQHLSDEVLLENGYSRDEIHKIRNEPSAATWI